MPNSKRMPNDGLGIQRATLGPCRSMPGPPLLTAFYLHPMKTRSSLVPAQQWDMGIVSSLCRYALPLKPEHAMAVPAMHTQYVEATRMLLFGDQHWLG